MNADRFLELQAMGLNSVAPKPQVEQPKKVTVKRSPYKPPPKATPIPEPSVSLGQVQPNFAAQSMISMDPFEAGPAPMPASLLSMPAMRKGPGAQDLRTDKYGNSQQRSASRETYQTPGDYYAHLDTVMNSPLMQQLASGADNVKGLRADFLKALPEGQVNLSPVMAFADYLAKGKGTAQAGYKPPLTMEDEVAKLASLMNQEQGDRQQMAQLGFQQAGDLKSGEEQAQTKTDADVGRVQGYKSPQPRSQMVSPVGQANMAGSFMRNFENSPVAKDSSQSLIAANSVRSHLANPNWLGDSAARAAIISAMKLAPVSNRDVEQITGSQDLFNRFSQLTNRLARGDVFTASDRRTVEKYADYLQKKAALNLETAADEYATSHGPMYGYDKMTAKSLLAPAMPKIQQPPERPPSMLQQMLQEEKARLGK